MTPPSFLPTWMTHLAATLVNLLAVAGGAAVGALLTGWLTKLLVRLTTRRQLPRWALILLRSLGGIVSGLLVWLLVFGSGGPGYGLGGGGWGLGAGSGQGTETARTTGPEQPVSSHREPPPTQPARADSLHIEMLGGDRVKGER